MPAFHPDTRRTGLGGFDEHYGGLVPCELVVLASDVLDQARRLALDIAAQATRGDPDRGHRPGQVWWYCAGVSWPYLRFRQEFHARGGDLARVSCTGVAGARTINARELERHARAWADAADVPGLVVVDALDDVGGQWATRAQAFKSISMTRPQVPVVALAHSTHAKGPKPATYADVGDAADFLLWATVPPALLFGDAGAVEVDVRKARNGFPEARFTLPRAQ